MKVDLLPNFFNTVYPGLFPESCVYYCTMTINNLIVLFSNYILKKTYAFMLIETTTANVSHSLRLFLFYVV